MGFRAVFLMKRPIGSPVRPKERVCQAVKQSQEGFLPSRGSQPLCIGMLDMIDIIVDDDVREEQVRR